MLVIILGEGESMPLRFIDWVSLRVGPKGYPQKRVLFTPPGGYPKRGIYPPKRVPLGLRTVAVIYPKMSLFKWAKSTLPRVVPLKGSILDPL